MNNARRKILCEIVAKLGMLINEEQEAFDNLPESIQDTEQGETMGDCVDVMQSASDELEGLTF